MPGIYDSLITQISNAFGVDPAFALSIHHNGEKYNPKNPISPKGATGPFQVMPDTFAEMAKELGISNPDINNPIHNTVTGLKYLKKQLDEFKDPALAAAAFNAGPNSVKKYGGIPPYKETQDYVGRVMNPMVGNSPITERSIIELPRSKSRSSVSPYDPVETVKQPVEPFLQWNTIENSSAYQHLNDDDMLKVKTAWFDKYVANTQTFAGLAPEKKVEAQQKFLTIKPPPPLDEGQVIPPHPMLDPVDLGTFIATGGVSGAAKAIGQGATKVVIGQSAKQGALEAAAGYGLGTESMKIGGEVGEKIGGEWGRILGEGVGGALGPYAYFRLAPRIRAPKDPKVNVAPEDPYATIRGVLGETAEADMRAAGAKAKPEGGTGPRAGYKSKMWDDFQKSGDTFDDWFRRQNASKVAEELRKSQEMRDAFRKMHQEAADRMRSAYGESAKPGEYETEAQFNERMNRTRAENDAKRTAHEDSLNRMREAYAKSRGQQPTGTADVVPGQMPEAGVPAIRERILAKVNNVPQAYPAQIPSNVPRQLAGSPAVMAGQAGAVTTPLQARLIEQIQQSPQLQNPNIIQQLPLPQEIKDALLVGRPYGDTNVRPMPMQGAVPERLMRALPPQVAEQLFPTASSAPETAGTRTGPTFDTAMRKPVKYPEPGAAASSITDSHMVNAETMGQVEQRILAGNKGIRDELGRIYDTRVKAEGEAGGETFKDWMNPQKVGGRIYQELRQQGVPHKEAKTRLNDLMKDYEAKYKDVLDTKSGAKQVGQREVMDVSVGWKNEPLKVVKNPTVADSQAMADIFREEFPSALKGEPKTRQTLDAQGNKYVWVNKATHDQVEKELKRKYGIDTNQNMEVKAKSVTPAKEGAKKAPEMIATEKGMAPQKAVDQSLVDQLRADLAARKGGQKAKQPWDMAKDEWLRSHGRDKEKTIWMYRVSGKEYHGGKSQEGLYVTRDLDFAGTFVTPESKLQLVKVKESALTESPEGARRGANLLQESMVKPSDIIESKEFKVRSKTYEGARAEIKDPHAMAVRDAAEKAITEGKPIPDEVLKKHPDLASKAKGAPDVPKEVQGKQGTKGKVAKPKKPKSGDVTLHAGIPLPTKAQLDSFVKSFREFWKPLSTIPESQKFMEGRYRAFGDMHRVDDFTKGLRKKILAFDEASRKDLYQYVDGQAGLASENYDRQFHLRWTTLDPKVQKAGDDLMRLIDVFGRMAVKRGLINEEAWKRRRGEYVRHTFLKHVLGEGYSPGSQSGRLDQSYNIRRKGLSKEQRAAYGELVDAAVSVPISINKVLTDVKKWDRFNAIAGNKAWAWQPSRVKFEGKVWAVGNLMEEVEAMRKVAEKLPGVPEVQDRIGRLERAIDLTRPPPDVENWRQFSGKKWGPLNGVWVRKPIYRDLKPFFEILSRDEGMSGIVNSFVAAEQFLMTMFKVGKVAFNPPTMVRNGAANIVFLWGSGMRPDQVFSRYIPESIQGMRVGGPRYELAKRHGIFKTNFSQAELGEITAALKEANRQNTWPAKAMTFLSKTGSFYGKIDDVFKFARFLHGLDHGESPGKAATEAHFWIMDYSLAHQSIKVARRQILPFVTFLYKSMPILARMVKERPWIIAVLAATPHILTEYFKRNLEITDEEWDKLQKELPSRIRKSHTTMLMPGRPPEGNLQWVDYSFFMPWGNSLQMGEAFVGGSTAEKMRSIGIGNPMLDIFWTGMSWRGGTPKDMYTGQDIFNQLDKPIVKAGKMLEWLYLRFGPNAFSSKGALGKTLDIGEKDRLGRTITPQQAIASWFGVNIFAPTQLQGSIELRSKLKELESSYFKAVRDPNMKPEDRQSLGERYIKERIRLIRRED